MDRPCPVSVGVTHGRVAHCLWNHGSSKTVLLQFVELESRCARQRTEGSNPSLSAIPDTRPTEAKDILHFSEGKTRILVSQRSTPATVMTVTLTESTSNPRNPTPSKGAAPASNDPQHSTPQHFTPPEAFPHKRFPLPRQWTVSISKCPTPTYRTTAPGPWCSRGVKFEL